MKFLISLLFVFSSSLSFANESSLKTFLGNLEGSWSGSSSFTELQYGSGAWVTSQATAQYTIGRTSPDGRWDLAVKETVSDTTVQPRETNFSLKVSGDVLLILFADLLEPVQINATDANTLSFQQHRVQPSTGQLYDLIYSFSLSQRGKHLKVVTTTVVNGVAIQTDTVNADRN